jgi:two-component system phosphate regulon sensor histidine kinase PhoR
MRSKPQKVTKVKSGFSPSLGQLILAGFSALLLIALTISTFTATRTAFKEASVLGEAEAPAASLIITQRESLVYAARVGEWIGGTIPRRDVQISRALLAQRLNVVDYSGSSTGKRAKPTFISSLKSLDQIVDNAPSGLLGETSQHKVFLLVKPLLDQFISDARDLVVQYQQAIDIQLNLVAKNRSQSSQRNLILVYSLVASTGILLTWFGATLLRQNRRAREQIILDTQILENTERKLESLDLALERKRLADKADLDSRESMRNAARAISISIREYSDHQEMAENFVSRVGEVFNCDYVVVATFPDDRVSQINGLWSAPELQGKIATIEIDPTALSETLESLWNKSSLLFLNENDAIGVMDVDNLSIGNNFRKIMKQNNFKNLLLLPIGEGTKAFGYVLVASSNPITEWDEYARQSLQFLSAHLAYSIIESELLATQRVVEELEALNDAKNDFISNVNHELRTPLTSIIGYIDLLKDQPENSLGPQATKFLATLDQNALVLLGLVESMLSISKLDSTQGSSIFHEVDLLKVIHSSIFVLEPAAAARNIRLILTANQDLAYLVSGDAGQLSQVFINLISNAIKFSHSDSEVGISIERIQDLGKPELIRIRVSDLGIGIPQEDIGKLFTRFFRGQNAIEGQLPGTGLGLAIVESIVKFHQGGVKVESTLGKGTTILVDLPTANQRVEALVAERRVGVLGRAIAALQAAPTANLYAVTHEMAGAVGMYSFISEGEELRDFSHWLKNFPDATPEAIAIKRNEILTNLQSTFDHVNRERV